MLKEKIKSFQDLSVWQLGQLGMEIVKEVYLLTKCFLKNELICKLEGKNDSFIYFLPFEGKIDSSFISSL